MRPVRLLGSGFCRGLPTPSQRFPNASRLRLSRRVWPIQTQIPLGRETNIGCRGAGVKLLRRKLSLKRVLLPIRPSRTAVSAAQSVGGRGGHILCQISGESAVAS